MTGSPIRFAIVGLDHHYWALDLAQQILSHPDATLVAIADEDLERTQPVARRFGVERVTASVDEVIADPDVDVIASFISVDRNPAICVAAARQGKPIISVKPLARTLGEATTILSAVRETGIHFLPAESIQRTAEQYRQLKDWIEEGRFGRILTSSVSQHAGLPQQWPGDSSSGWFIDPRRSPGGGWIDHSIYQIDRLRWLLGQEVEAIGGPAGNLKYPDLPVEDYGSATVRFGGGVIATVEVTWIAPPGGGGTRWNIIGTEGAVVYDGMTARLSVIGKFPPFQGWIHVAPRPAGGNGVDHMIKVIRGEEQLVANVEDAWRNLAACVAFYEAAGAGTERAPADLP